MTSGVIALASGMIEFQLSDGTSLTVRDEDRRRIYEVLWGLSNLPGAISAAAVLIHESRQPAPLRVPIKLDAAQGDALRKALAKL